MARPVEWFQRVPQILAVLEAPDQPALYNRRSIQELFGVQQRNAHALLRRFGATRLGNALVIERLQLSAALKSLLKQDDTIRQLDRHRKVREVLAERRAVLQLARISLPEPTTARAVLPPSIRLEPGFLAIEFSSAVDLLSQLLELSRAIGEDFDRYEGMLNRDPLLS